MTAILSTDYLSENDFFEARYKMPMRWIERQRAAFIFGRLQDAGSVRRADVIQEFDVSVPTASVIFTWFQDEFPDAMVYDLKARAYKPGLKFLDHFQGDWATVPAKNESVEGKSHG